MPHKPLVAPQGPRFAAIRRRQIELWIEHFGSAVQRADFARGTMTTSAVIRLAHAKLFEPLAEFALYEEIEDQDLYCLAEYDGRFDLLGKGLLRLYQHVPHPSLDAAAAAFPLRMKAGACIASHARIEVIRHELKFVGVLDPDAPRIMRFGVNVRVGLGGVMLHNEYALPES